MFEKFKIVRIYMDFFLIIKNDGVIKCQCCLNNFDTKITPMFVWRPLTDLLPEMKTIYCDWCKDHPGYYKCQLKK